MPPSKREHPDKEGAVTSARLRMSMQSARFFVSDDIQEKILKKMANTTSLGELTKRELAVTFLASHGFYNKEIAQLLGTTINTVNGQQKDASAKLGAKNRAHAISIALRNGLFY